MAEDRSGFAATTNTTDRAFVTATSLVFLTSGVVTVYLCRSMSGGMPMPGGWSMSMAWMRMPGQTWLGAAAMFVWMWTVMMVAMMLPAVVPILRPQRRFAPVVATGYFAVWAAIGAAVYPIGIALAMVEMRSPAVARAVPLATGAAVLVAGLIQLLPWKARVLMCCRRCDRMSGARSAWSYGVRSGIHCALCCSGFMLAFIVIGVMNLGAMALTAAAIAVERVAPQPDVTARIAGALLIALGAVLVFRAV